MEIVRKMKGGSHFGNGGFTSEANGPTHPKTRDMWANLAGQEAPLRGSGSSGCIVRGLRPRLTTRRDSAAGPGTRPCLIPG